MADSRDQAERQQAASGFVAAEVQMQVDVAVLKTQVSSIDKKLDALAVDLRDTYARKTEMKDLADDVKGLRDSLGWVIKLILGLVVAAIISTVLIKSGGRI